MLGTPFVLQCSQDRPPQGVGACVWRAAECAAEHRGARILLVKFSEIATGHAWCVYGNIASDWRGARLVELGDALTVARRLPPPLPGLTVRSAQFFEVK
jgi:hypothetical protein